MKKCVHCNKTYIDSFNLCPVCGDNLVTVPTTPAAEAPAAVTPASAVAAASPTSVVTPIMAATSSSATGNPAPAANPAAASPTSGTAPAKTDGFLANNWTFLVAILGYALSWVGDMAVIGTIASAGAAFLGWMKLDNGFFCKNIVTRIIATIIGVIAIIELFIYCV